MSSLEDGIIISWSGISDNNHQSDLFMDHMFVEIPLIFMMDIFLLELMLIKDNCNYGTSELVSQSKIFLGMRDSHQRKHAKSTEPNSKRTREI